MYGICYWRFNLCFFPYASRKFICNSWVAAQEMITDVMIVSDMNGSNCLVPCTKSESLSIGNDKTDENTSTSYEDKVFEWCSKRKEKGDSNEDIFDQLKEEMHCSLISFPIIYMSRHHLHLNRSSTFLNAVESNIPKVNCPNLLMRTTDEVESRKSGFHSKDKLKKKDDKKDTDPLAKSVEDTKKNIQPQAEGAKGKLGKLDKVGSSMFGKKKAKKTKAAKKTKSASAGGGGLSWAAIEKKLPVWQNTIADTLQKLQDLVFKQR